MCPEKGIVGLFSTGFVCDIMEFSRQYLSVLIWHLVCPFTALINLVWWPLCWYRGWWHVIVLYALWYACSYNWPFDGRLRGWPGLRRFLRPWFQCYASNFPLTLQYSNLMALKQQIKRSKGVIFSCHPHGILPSGTMNVFTLEPTQLQQDLPMIDFHYLTLDLNLKLPFMREWLMIFGFGGVNRQSIISWLKPRNNLIPAVAITPGGARETLYALPHTLYIVLENRQGFIKMAKETGSLLVPVITFGENEVVSQIETTGWVRKAQEWLLRKTGVGIPIVTSLLPRKLPLTVMVGEGIVIGKDDDISAVHAKFKEALHQMHADAKLRLGRPLPPIKFI